MGKIMLNDIPYTGGINDNIEIVTALDDSVTDTSVPSAKAVYDELTARNIKTYSTLESIGLADGCTVSDIYIALPTSGMFILNATTTKVTDIPAMKGVLTIYKPVAGFVDITFKETSITAVAPNNLWLGTINGGDGTGLIWNRVRITTTAEDVTTITGNGVKIRYDENWVHIRIAINSFTQESSTTSTVATLPENVVATEDVYSDGLILNGGWHPIAVNAYVCFPSGTSDIEVRVSGSVSSGVLIVDKTYPRQYFNIT